MTLDGTVHSGTSKEVNIIGTAVRLPALAEVGDEAWGAKFIGRGGDTLANCD